MLPGTPPPMDIPVPLPKAPGLGRIICPAVCSLRGLLTRLSYPISTMLFQLIDAFYPFLQGLLCRATQEALENVNFIVY